MTDINIKLLKHGGSETDNNETHCIEGQYSIDDISTMTIRKSAYETNHTKVDCDSVVQFETKNGITVYGKWIDEYDKDNHYGFIGAYFTTENSTYLLTYDCLLSLMDLSSIIDNICLS